MNFDNIDVMHEGRTKPSRIGVARLDDDYVLRIDTTFTYQRITLTPQEAEALKNLLNRHL